MYMPESLSCALNEALAGCKTATLMRAATDLSARYREEHTEPHSFITSPLDYLAYVAVRMPGTYAAMQSILAQLQKAMPAVSVTSMLDLGAGPGTASWAAQTIFKELEQMVLVEREERFIQIGKSLAAHEGSLPLNHAQWLANDFYTLPPLDTYDLVVAAYALNEVSIELAKSVVAAAWKATKNILVLVEPGTMAGSGLIRLLRDDLIAAGGHVVAPCSHQHTCALPADDWCHFSIRLHRTPLLRRLKSGTLDYEDEKFSYVVVSKHPVNTVAARVLRHPLRYAGHTKIQVCTPEGLVDKTITRSNKAAWKRIKKTDWGDAWQDE